MVVNMFHVQMFDLFTNKSEEKYEKRSKEPPKICEHFVTKMKMFEMCEMCDFV